ncbi:MAG: T9SS type B sorting domain-containing protein [Lutibacter sp.]
MKRIGFISLILFPLFLFAQNEAAIWYFGNRAGLDFNSGSPVVLTDGLINTYEGCATISDSNGNLIFYTDGVQVWDRNHNIMPNGTGLDGNASSSQSAIIIPKPNNADQYYIFTVDQNPTGSTNVGNGVNYSIVDMTLNGGNGDITTKNTNILPWAFEKITAVRHANNNSFWVITYRRDTFYAWHVDATGVNAPITSTPGVNANNARGYLKTSIDGSKIVSANFGNTGNLLLYDFDNATGIISNETQLNFNDPGDIPYGVEFSNSGTKLYATTCRLPGTGVGPPGRLYQFDLANGNARTLIEDQNAYTRGALQLGIDMKIYRALSTVTSSQNNASGTAYLGVINNPENVGLACNYVSDAIDVTVGGFFPTHKVFEGLPPFMQSYFLEPNIAANDVCLGNPTQFNFNSTSPPTTITWDFGDPASGTSNTSTLENPAHTFSSSGIFTVTAVGTIGASNFNLTLDITIYDLPTVNSPVTLTLCDDNLDGIENFDLTAANALINNQSPSPTITYFLTETDAIANINPIATPTSFSNSTQSTVWARVENSTGCFDTAQVDLQVESINIPNALQLIYNECDDLADGDDTNGFTTFDFSSATNQILNALLPETNLTVSYYETINDAMNQTNAINPSNYTNTTVNSQQIAIRVDRTTDTCFGVGFHITLNVTPVPDFTLPATVALCLNSNSTIKAENPNDTYDYVWTDSSGTIIGDTQEIQISSADNYTVTATDTNGNGCSKSKTIQVNEIPTQPLLNFNQDNIEIIDNSSNNSITVNTNNLPASNYEYALDNGNYQTDNIFNNVSGGLHTINIKDVDNCLEASLQVSLIAIPNFFTPNNDGYNDTWQVTGINNQPTSKIYVFDRFGKLITILNPLGNGWDGYYKGNPLPSTDYWYRVELEDGRLLRGHFSLIRN